MKKVLLVLAVVFFSKVSHSQVFVGDVNINDLDVKYVQIIGYNTSLFGKKMEVVVDYGQKKLREIKDEKGKTIKFNSMTHALNFMSENGWKYLNYMEVVSGRKVKALYLLERKAKK